MTAPSIDRDPPAWATALARHRDGLRKLIRSLLEEEAGRPMWALDALLAAIPADQRAPLLEALRIADGPDGSDWLTNGMIDEAVRAYETHVAAAYQHGPHLGRWQDATVIAAAAVDEHADEILAALDQIPVTVVKIVTEPHTLMAEGGDRVHLYTGACQCRCKRCERPEGGCICPDCNGECLGHVGTPDEIAAKIGGTS